MRYAREENGNITIYNQLPATWKNRTNFPKHPTSTHEAMGFYLIIQPVKAEHEKYGDIYFDLNNKVFTYYILPMNQQEIDRYEQKKLDIDSSAQKREEHKNDGEEHHRRFWDYVMRNLDEGNITQAQFDEVVIILYEPTLPLTLGFWRIAKVFVDILPANADPKINGAINKVKTGITQYINNKY